MKHITILLALCAGLQAEEPAPKATPKPFPFTPSGALGGAKLGSPKLGETHSKVEGGWLLQMNAKGQWVRVKKLSAK